MKTSSVLRSAIDKSVQFLAFIPVIVWVMYPYIARAEFSSQSTRKAAQVFEVKGQIPNGEKAVIGAQNTDQIMMPVPSLAYEEVARNDLGHQTKLAYKEKLRQYLESRRSPFANCVDTIVELKNADKILSLANAESSLGLRAPAGKHNYWGVGGSKLWQMGSTVCEGIVSMDNFLNEYPRRSPVKYAEMSIDRMNGLYKQPRAQHWANNNYAITNKLTALRAEAAQIAQARVSTPVNIATAQAELVK